MNAFAQFLDGLLLCMVALTVLLIVVKTVDLYLPKWRGKPDLLQQLGDSALSRERGLRQLEKGLTLLAVIASTAPFVGLAGTVLHIIDALRALGTGLADMALISGPIATALNATLLGLCSAVPALAASTLFWRKLDTVEAEHQLLTTSNQKEA